MKKRPKIKKILRSNYLWITISITILFVIYLILQKIQPFGNKSIFRSDMFSQYVNFFCYFRDAILEGKSLLFSWNLGLGNDFWGSFGYYLASPLNLLVVFFNEANMNTFMLILTWIKLVLAGNTMVFFLQKSFQYSKRDALVFGMMYAFCSYVTCYMLNIMWLDAVYMLPIVLYTTDQYVEKKKIGPYILAMAYTILTNFYIGFMVALFAGLYYLTKYFVHYRIKKQWRKYVVKLLKSTIIYIGSTLLAVGVVAIITIPEFVLLFGGVRQKVQDSFWNIIPEKFHMLIPAFFNNYIYGTNAITGLLFSGTISILLLPMYYGNSKIEKREKMLFSILFFIMLLPIYIVPLMKLWHGTQTPCAFEYRYTFVISFLLIYMAFQCYQKREGVSKKVYIFTFILFILACIMEIIGVRNGWIIYEDNYMVRYVIKVVITLTILFTLGIAIWIAKNKEQGSKSKVITIFLILLTILDLSVAAVYNKDKEYTIEEYAEDREFIQKFKKSILSIPELQRIVMASDDTGGNLALRYGYSNIGYYSSSGNSRNIKNMHQWGNTTFFIKNVKLTSFNGTPLNYSMQSVEYYIAKDKEDIEAVGKLKNFQYIGMIEDRRIYQNQNAFPIGYYLKDNKEIKDKNAFEIQNEFLNSLMHTEKEEYFTKVPFKGIDIQQDTINFKTTYYDKQENVVTDTYYITADKDSTLYVSSPNNLIIQYNDKKEKISYGSPDNKNNGITAIKNLKAGEKVKLQIYHLNLEDTILLYTSDDEKLMNTLNIASQKQTLSNVQVENRGLEADVKMEEEGYLTFAIPYHPDWDIFVDGKEVTAEEMYGINLGIKLDKGEYHIQIQYNNNAFLVGTLVSILCIGILVFILYKERKKECKNENK